MAVFKEENAILEKFERNQVYIYNFAEDLGLIATTAVKDTMRSLLQDLIEMGTAQVSHTHTDERDTTREYKFSFYWSPDEGVHWTVTYILDKMYQKEYFTFKSHCFHEEGE